MSETGELVKLQHAFLRRMLGDSSDENWLLSRLESDGALSAGQRMSVYASGYRIRLREALATDLERVHTYLGDEQFASLCNDYIDRYPSDNPSLRHFSRHILAFVTDNLPWNRHPQLAELCRIELAMHTSFDSSDAPAARVDDLITLEADRWPALRLGFQDSVQLIQCHHNGFPIWKALNEAQDQIPAPMAETSVWLVWRKQLISQYRRLETDEAALLFAACEGRDFASLCEILLEWHPPEQTPIRAVRLLNRWLEDEMVRAPLTQD